MLCPPRTLLQLWLQHFLLQDSAAQALCNPHRHGVLPVWHSQQSPSCLGCLLPSVRHSFLGCKLTASLGHGQYTHTVHKHAGPSCTQNDSLSLLCADMKLWGCSESDSDDDISSPRAYSDDESSAGVMTLSAAEQAEIDATLAGR